MAEKIQQVRKRRDLLRAELAEARAAWVAARAARDQALNIYRADRADLDRRHRPICEALAAKASTARRQFRKLVERLAAAVAVMRAMRAEKRRRRDLASEARRAAIAAARDELVAANLTPCRDRRPHRPRERK